MVQFWLLADLLDLTPQRLTVGKAESSFTPQDRIGQLTMRNNDIADTREKLIAYVNSGLISLSDKSAIPQLQGGVEQGAGLSATSVFRFSRVTMWPRPSLSS